MGVPKNITSDICDILSLTNATFLTAGMNLLCTKNPVSINDIHIRSRTQNVIFCLFSANLVTRDLLYSL